MMLCLLGVENARDIHKNKMMKADFNKVARLLQLRKIIPLATAEASVKGYENKTFQRVSLMIS